MGCKHTLSTVDDGLSECTTCGVLIPHPVPPPLPRCHVYRCDDDGNALDLDGNPVCLRHDIRYPIRGVA